MLAKARSLLEQAWPLLGSLYLLYLALQAPPIRYVGVAGLVVVTPLLLGWFLGAVLGVGPWADTPDGDGEAGETPGTGRDGEAGETQGTDRDGTGVDAIEE